MIRRRRPASTSAAPTAATSTPRPTISATGGPVNGSPPPGVVADTELMALRLALGDVLDDFEVLALALGDGLGDFDMLADGHGFGYVWTVGLDGTEHDGCGRGTVAVAGATISKLRMAAAPSAESTSTSLDFMKRFLPSIGSCTS